MFRIKELYLKGFKNPNRELKIQFADAPVTIIYGENGSGKTTLLQVIQAIFKQDFEFLKSQNISLARIDYELNEEAESVEINMGEDIAFRSNNNTFNNLSSALFGIHRGMVDYNQAFLKDLSKKIKDNVQLVESFMLLKMNDKTIREGWHLIQSLKKIPSDIDSKLSSTIYSTDRHSTIDNVEVQVLEYTLRSSFEKGEKMIITNISNAFFSTIDNALNTPPNITPPKNFHQRFSKRKTFFELFINRLSDSATKDKLKYFLDEDNYDNLEKEAPLFKVLLINMLEAAEKDERENIDLKAITMLVSTFNEFIIHQKKLVLNAVEIYIAFPNGQRHSLADLSSGERHLLSFLTLFLITTRNRNFFLIDEPEISLSMKWQRRLLTLLSEFSPHSQIIVATHSPEMADGKPEYLMKGKLI